MIKSYEADDTYEARLHDLETMVSSLLNRIGSLEARLNFLYDQLEEYPQKVADLNELQVQIDKVRNALM